MCGEHAWGIAICPRSKGSSPHVRGAHVLTVFAYVLTGIIPACAGSTSVSRRASTAAWDHPRMCGEHADEHATGVVAWGSSPHVRGAHQAIHAIRRLVGIIPACAGSTKYVCANTVARWDHPRMCGEHPYRIIPIPEDMGSSPHVRGALCSPYPMGRCRGIIPACAGSTMSEVMKGSNLRDHPRMCGEHRGSSQVRSRPAGSSPHVRGALLQLQVVLGVLGIIPACAGST